MEISKTNFTKLDQYLPDLEKRQNDLDYLVNLVQQENNLVARDLVVHNLFNKIYNLLSARYFRFYSWTPIENDDIKTITFLAIDSAIKNFAKDRNVPFDYYVKLHSLLFFVQYARQFSFKRHYVLNRCINFENKTQLGSSEYLLIDDLNPTPVEYTKYQICFGEIQKVLKKLSKVERAGLLLRLQGYTYANIYELLALKRKRLEYIIKQIRLRCDYFGGDNLAD